jgi:DNA polymerase-3 subunit beta
VTNEHSRGVDFTFGNGKAVLAARAAESGQSHVEMPVAYDGADITVCLDPRFMNEFLKVLDPEKVVIVEAKDAESAVVCHTDDDYSYVIMPLARDRA